MNAQMEISVETHSAVVDQDGKPIITDNKLLLCETATQELITIPFTNDVANGFGLIHLIKKQNKQHAQQNHSTDTETTDDEQSKIWTTENTLYLIDCVQKFERLFSTGVKKNVWQKVAEQCKHLHKNITAKNCEIKWKSLTRTYKNILLSNNTSGQKKRYWEFYDIMHSIMYKKPEITAVATCSSLTGLHVNKEQEKETEQQRSERNDETNKEDSNGIEITPFESAFHKKRKQKVSEAEKRHREKMQRLDRFNDLFETMITNKMPENK